MSQLFNWGLQLTILSAGIFVFLRLIRTTRGSRIVRGLVVSLLVGFLGLFALSEVLQLEELRFIIRNVAGFVVVIFAILFQPELRRGIAQLGTGGLFDRLIKNLGSDSLSRVSQAACAMASRRTGALIAIERENPLDAYIEGGVRIDSTVSKLLIETIFHPGSTLHDGAIIIRGERIASAASLFPLTENLEIARSTGTRHRAAMGLSDETDAVTVVVSEETGEISICKRGKILPHVAQAELDDTLREAVGPDMVPDGLGPGARPGEAVKRFLRRDLLWLSASVALSVGLLVLARQSLQEENDIPLNVVKQFPDQRSAPRPGQLVVVLPSQNYNLRSNQPRISVQLSATRGQLNEFRDNVYGVYELSEPIESPVRIDVDDVQWTPAAPGLAYTWTGDQAPNLAVDSFDQGSFELTSAALDVDLSRHDARYTALVDQARFEPSSILVTGPADALADLDTPELPLRFDTVAVPRTQTSGFRATLKLTPQLRTSGFSIEGPIAVTIPIVPAELSLPSFERDVALVCTDPARHEELGRWEIPAAMRSVSVHIETSGLVAAGDAESPFIREQREEIRKYVDLNLTLFVDLADLPLDGSSQMVLVQHRFKRDWRQALGELVFLAEESGDTEGNNQLLERATFEVVIEGEREIRLNPTAEAPQ